MELEGGCTQQRLRRFSALSSKCFSEKNTKFSDLPTISNLHLLQLSFSLIIQLADDDVILFGNNIMCCVLLMMLLCGVCIFHTCLRTRLGTGPIKGNLVSGTGTRIFSPIFSALTSSLSAFWTKLSFSS